MVGKVVGSYRIVEKIGEGGMGAVYRAVDVMLERDAAVKAIRPDLAREPHIVERFRAEAKTLARLHHPAIAVIYSFFHDGDDLYLAMEYVRGRSLSEALREEGPFRWQEAVPLLASALDGIEQAHRIGVIHRDLKPDNLMLTETGTLKVMDFGIARVVGSSHLTRTGLLVGTLRYMAPEQIRGEEVDRRTDVYALGTVLYEMLTGRTPFAGGSDYAILRAQIEEAPAPPSQSVPGLPDWLDRAVLKALAKDPAERFQTVAELHSLLAGHAGLAALPLAESSGLAAPGAPSPSAATRPDRRLRTLEPPLPTRAPARVTTAPVPVSPPPTGAGSYRPMPARESRFGWGATIAVALVLIGIGAAFWLLRGDRSETQAATASTAAAPAVLPETGSQSLPAAPLSGGMARPAARETPPPQEPVPRSQEPRRTVVPPPQVALPPSPEPEPPAFAEEQEPAGESGEAEEPSPASPSPEAEAAQAPLPPALGELRQIAGELQTESKRLYTLYETFLEQKEESDLELTAADELLLEELELFEDAAAAFDKQFKEGLLARTRGRLRGRARNDRAELARRGQTLAEHGRRVEALMAQVQPGPEVRQAWQEVRQRWQRVGQIVAPGR